MLNSSRLGIGIEIFTIRYNISLVIQYIRLNNLDNNTVCLSENFFVKFSMVSLRNLANIYSKLPSRGCTQVAIKSMLYIFQILNKIIRKLTFFRSNFSDFASFSIGKINHQQHKVYPCGVGSAKNDAKI